jgi:hypothetical protein
MRASILAVALGPVFVASAQAAPVWRNTAGIELGAAPQIELARDGWTPAAKTTLIATITAAIQAAIAEERQQLTSAL